MPLGLQAIRLRQPAVIRPNLAETQRALRQFLVVVGGDMAYYPAQRRGTNYRRTGSYGRGWTAPGAIRTTPSEGTLVNRVPYAVYVGGPSDGPAGGRQTQDMKSRGWKSITRVVQNRRGEYADRLRISLVGRPG